MSLNEEVVVKGLRQPRPPHPHTHTSFTAAAAAARPSLAANSLPIYFPLTLSFLTHTRLTPHRLTPQLDFQIEDWVTIVTATKSTSVFMITAFFLLIPQSLTPLCFKQLPLSMETDSCIQSALVATHCLCITGFPHTNTHALMIMISL
jgi:hypothetical protein